MKYESDHDYRQALEERLKNRNKETGVPLVRLRKRLVFERCMVRLQKKPNSPWVLKGGFAMELRLGQRARMTQDLDLGVDLRLFSEDQATKASLAQRLREDLAGEGEDRFIFIVPERREEELRIRGVKAYRFTVEARLAGREFETFRVDVGLGDPVVSPIESLTGSDLLSFAGIPIPEIQATSRAQHLAEKIHALTRPFDDRINTRVKDLADSLLLIDHGPDPSEFKKAVEEIFTTRESHAIPSRIEAPPQTWVSSFTAMALDLGLTETTLDDAITKVNHYWKRSFP